MKLKNLLKAAGKGISAVTGKPTTTASVVGEVANLVAKRTGAIDPEVAEAIAESTVRKIKRKAKAKASGGDV